MKPDWDKVMKKYRGHEHVLVADVDCTLSVSKPLCDRIGIKGYPTIKYGNPDDLQDYEGERTAKGMYRFAKENLGPQCGPAHVDLCSSAQKKRVNKYLAMEETELDGAIAEKTMKELEAENKLKDIKQRVDRETQEAKDKHKAWKKELKAAGYALMKSVLASRRAAAAASEGGGVLGMLGFGGKKEL